ncbi:hypothetical protein F5888DRAFT_1636945 [Russula emetica]|nr:hypothetical protein F5888DRAFT_1636945 [Russula emetica]
MAARLYDSESGRLWRGTSTPHTALASFDMPDSSKRKHEEDLGVGEFISDMARNGNLTPELGARSVARKNPVIPQSEWEKVMKDSIQWLDVYKERGSQNRGSARLRLMDAWHVPVCAPFKGRVVDRSEKPMPGTSETSGGDLQLQHQGVILLVVELNLAFKDDRDHVAQVLLELASAYKDNNDKDFEPQPPVYAVLTDLQHFYFFSYDGSTFKMDTEIWVYSATRAHFLDGMAGVTERLFSTILQGYNSILNAVIERSRKRGIIGDTVRPSPDNLTKAIIKALWRVWEDAGQRGLYCLEESVAYLDKIGSLTDWDQQHEIDKVLLSRCKPRDPLKSKGFSGGQSFASPSTSTGCLRDHSEESDTSHDNCPMHISPRSIYLFPKISLARGRKK